MLVDTHQKDKVFSVLKELLISYIFWTSIIRVTSNELHRYSKSFCIVLLNCKLVYSIRLILQELDKMIFIPIQFVCKLHSQN